MTLADLTALLSRVSKENPDLMKSREVALFIQACIEEARKTRTTTAASPSSSEPDTGRSR
jgi:hypothetical protein